jgi:hypothetical protein
VNEVIDHERIAGVYEDEFEVAVVYEVAGEVIRNVWSFPKEWPP